MSHSKPGTKAPSPRTGLLASARAVLRGAGGGAPASRVPLAVIVLVGLLLAGSLAPSFASAAFTRPLLCQIGSVPSPEAVAVDGSGDLWVSETVARSHGNEPLVGKLYEFGPVMGGACGGFLGPVGGSAPREITPHNKLQNMAIEQETGRFYFVGTEPGTSSYPVNTFEQSGVDGTAWANKDTFEAATTPPDVAVDSSTASVDPSRCGSAPLSADECFVYVAHGDTDDGAPFGDGLPPGIEKFNGKGEARPFVEGGNGYVSGDEIQGTPSGGFDGQSFGALAVDGAGDLFAVDRNSAGVTYDEGVVDEWEASGRFVRQFVLSAAPRFGREGSDSEVAVGVAVDAVSGHLLVSVQDAEASAVDEFDLASGDFVDQVVGRDVGPGGLVKLRSLATDGAGDVFGVDEGRHVVDVWGLGHFDPTVMVAEASGREPQSAVLHGSVDPEGFKLTDCHFEFVPQSQFESEKGAFTGVTAGEQAPCVPAVGSIALQGFTEVSASVSGLVSGVTYEYRLVASNEGELGGTGVSGVLPFTAPHAPVIEPGSVGVDDVSSRSVDLEAVIDPLGADTSYRFEVLTAAAFAANGGSFVGPEVPVSVPVAGGDLGVGGPTGSSREKVVQPVSGLVSGVSYVFRVVAENKCEAVVHPGRVCVAEGEVGSFVTEGVAEPGLPDGRAYELVTPVDKGAGSDMFSRPLTQEEYSNEDRSTPSESGEGLLLETKAAFGPFPGSGSSAYVFSRDGAASGWGFQSLAEPSLGVQNLIGVLADPADFSTVAMTDGVGDAAGASGESLVSVVGGPGGPYASLHADPAFRGVSPTKGSITEVVGGSRDLNHVVLESEEGALCKGSEEKLALKHGHVLCEWAGGGGLRLVNASSEGLLVSTCGAVLGSRAPGKAVVGSAHGAVSADGSKVFFTAPDPTAENTGVGCWKPQEEAEKGRAVNAPQLYMRTDGETVTISAAQKGVSEAGGVPREYPAAYAGASEDGSRVFFASESWLTMNHPSGHDMELYEYNTVTRTLRRISAGEEAVNPGGAIGAEVRAVPAIAAEGKAVYFLAFGALAGTAKQHEPTGEEVNLYRYDTENATTTFVETVTTGDYPVREECDNTELGEFAPCSRQSWYTTPDGRFLLFSHEVPGTGPSGKGCTDYNEGSTQFEGHCTELYRYQYEPGSSTGGSVLCVSCNPDGMLPISNASFTRSAPASVTSGPVRALSDDGSYAFFDSADPLVPSAENHTLNVYEWHEGRISLLSSPSDTYPSFFLGYSPYTAPSGRRVEGGNVFIGTHANLLSSQDTESEGNVYDARICRPEEGAPCIQPPAGETAQCLGTACQNPPPAPVDSTPASLTFTGAGNLLTEPPPVAVVVKPKALTKAQKLANALRSCRKDRARKKRTVCEKAARRTYGAVRARKPAHVDREAKR